MLTNGVLKRLLGFFNGFKRLIDFKQRKDSNFFNQFDLKHENKFFTNYYMVFSIPRKPLKCVFELKSLHFYQSHSRMFYVRNVDYQCLKFNVFVGWKSDLNSRFPIPSLKKSLKIPKE